MMRVGGVNHCREGGGPQLHEHLDAQRQQLGLVLHRVVDGEEPLEREGVRLLEGGRLA